MLNKKIIITSIFFTLLASLAVIFQPVPSASEGNTLKTIGTIEKVYKAGSHDLVLKLKGDDHLFYVANGTNPDVTFASLTRDLTGKDVEVYYVKYWSPLNQINKLKHIAKLEVNRTTLYSNQKQQPEAQ